MIARRSLLIVYSTIVLQALGFVGLAILAKMWGDYSREVLGIIGFAMSFIGVFNLLANLGFQKAHIKRVSEGQDLGTCIGTFVAIKVFLTSLMVIITLTALFIWQTFLDGDFTDATTQSMIYIFLIYYIFQNLIQIPVTTFNATREIAKMNICQIIGRSIKVPLSLFVIFAGVHVVGIPPAFNWPDFLQPAQEFFSKHPSGSYGATYAIDMIIAFAASAYLIRKYPISKPTKEMLKSYFDFALPLMLMSIIGVVSINIDKIMIGYFWTNKEVGDYFAVQRVYEVITMLYMAVATVLFPTISKYHTKNKINKIIEITHSAERYISMVIIPVVIVIIIFAVDLIKILLHESYLMAVPILMVLTLYTFSSALTKPYTQLVIGINMPKRIAQISVAICVINIILNLLLIPEKGLLSFIRFGHAGYIVNGPTGAAMATLLSSLIGFFGVRLIANKLTGIKIIQTHTPRHLIAGAVMAGILYYIAFIIKLFPQIHWYTFVFYSFFGLGIYLAVLFVLKEFNKKELYFFLNTLNPLEMCRYIKDEFKGKNKD